MVFVTDIFSLFYYYYHQRMWRGNVFVVSVFLCTLVSVWAVTFEADGIETFGFITVVDEYHI